MSQSNVGGEPHRGVEGVPQRMRIGSRLGIHWNFFVYMMLFVLMLIILLWSFQIVFFEEIYKVIKIKET